MDEVILIHPLDFAEILRAEDGPIDIIFKYERDGVEVVEIPDTKYKGIYRQTVEVPVKTNKIV